MTATETKSIDLDPRLRGGERTRDTSGTKLSVAVIIPTFNEADSIGAVIAALPRVIGDRVIFDRIIVVDGGSTDGTPERAQVAGAEVIAVGRAAMAARVLRAPRPPAAPTFSSTWTATAPTIPRQSPR